MIVFQKKDKKFLSWKNELSSININSYAVEGSAIKAPFFLLKLLLQKRSVKVYVFRYLNDYPSLFKTVLRLISELLVVLLSRIFNIRIWWICHNVDKETSMNYPYFSRIRRAMISRASVRIFTTNKLLIPYAKELFNTSKVDSISLGFIEGKPIENISLESNINEDLIIWIKSHQSSNTRFIFCAGTPESKSLHFSLINSFIDNVNKYDTKNVWYAIVIGTFVENNNKIYNIPSKHFVDKKIIIEYIDFYYRVMDDFSISYTLYEASEYELPIITENYGILPEIIEYYQNGLIYDENDIEVFLESINKRFDFITFKNENNWKQSAATFYKYYLNNTAL